LAIEGLSDEDVAGIACNGEGDASTLSRYLLLHPDDPDASVLGAIIARLLAGTAKLYPELRLKPAMSPEEAAELPTVLDPDRLYIADKLARWPRDEADLILYLTTRNGRPRKGELLSATIALIMRISVFKAGSDRKLMHEIADMLAEEGTSRLKLRFRRRPGNPATEIRTDIEMVLMGQRDAELRKKGVPLDYSTASGVRAGRDQPGYRSPQQDIKPVHVLLSEERQEELKHTGVKRRTVSKRTASKARRAWKKGEPGRPSQKLPRVNC
jgi:hypothetical protein